MKFKSIKYNFSWSLGFSNYGLSIKPCYTDFHISLALIWSSSQISNSKYSYQTLGID